MQEKGLGVGIVGTGFMGSTHANAWAKVPYTKYIAICETSPRMYERAEELAFRLNAKLYKSYEELLKDPNINVVDICLPTFLHRDYAVKAMEAGKHVLLEKPIALRLKDAREIIDTAKKTGVKFMVAHVLRFFPEYVRIKYLVDVGAIGEPRIARAYRYSSFPAWSVKGWYGEHKLSGGVVVDMAIHDYDFLRWVFNDDVDRVCALAPPPEKKVIKEITAVDHGMIILKFKKGGIAFVMTSWSYPKGYPFSTYFEIAGTNGILHVDNKITAPLRIAKPDLYEGRQVFWQDPYYLEILHFAEHIVEGKPLRVTPEDAYKALEIALAVLKSALEGGVPVNLPLKEEVIP
ncbi:MAG: gfo/Idh/MocA family oxidoreductase [Thermoprotei archaeon]|nr:MAG: gfo/Idh/MocA family oxidoreductase [Thermoprotei archaeon]